MSSPLSDWTVDENVYESSTTGEEQEFPEYISGRDFAVSRSFVGYVSPQENTLVVAGELYRPGNPEDPQLFVYLYEPHDRIERGVPQVPFWLFDAGDEVESAKSMAHELAEARAEIEYDETDLEFVPRLREAVPELEIHREHGEGRYDDGGDKQDDASLRSSPGTGHPLEGYLPGYVFGTQYQKYWPVMECESCGVELEGANGFSWECDSTVVFGRTESGQYEALRWFCSDHSPSSLGSALEDIPPLELLKEWRERMDRRQELIDERAKEVEIDPEERERIERKMDRMQERINERSEEGRIMRKKAQKAKQQLIDEGVLEQFTDTERAEKRKIRMHLPLGNEPDEFTERYYLVRCNLDCMCFGRYYQNITYIRDPVVLDEEPRESVSTEV